MGGDRWSKVCDIVVVVKVMQEFGIFPADRFMLCMCVCVLVGYFSWKEVCDPANSLYYLYYTLANQHY